MGVSLNLSFFRRLRGGAASGSALCALEAEGAWSMAAWLVDASVRAGFAWGVVGAVEAGSFPGTMDARSRLRLRGTLYCE